MDPSRDNLLIRFKAFIDSLGVFTIFAVILLLILGIGALFGWFKQGEDTEIAGAAVRYENRDKLNEDQAAVIDPDVKERVMPGVAKTLLNSKPVAVEKPEQIVPGSETAQNIANEPGPDLSAIDAPVDENAEAEPIDPAMMEIGKAQFLVCAACHGQNGEGGLAAPPLAGSEWVSGPISNLIRIQFRGLEGPITVAGKEYNFPVGMQPMAYQSDEQIAGVLTYVRNSFGNEGSAVTVEQVASLRSEVGKPLLKVEELTKP
ncbi:c-type cytochrome [Luteolibacter sp. AS25]|uniref:c-type cytochrome n=1 Tax=Luteolibacter sp. AS25 TaxID=3135776 RepID=UPI00398AD173